MPTYTVELQRIPWHADGGLHPLGRHVEHDSRSLDYLFEPRRAVTVHTVRHTEHTGVLDQGRLGACTGFTAEAVAGATPCYLSIPSTVAARPTGDTGTDNNQAINLYSQATKLDPFQGAWPPSDTGSTGLAAAKAMKDAGLIAGYQHATSVQTAIAALMTAPIMIGINWYSSFDQPAADGTISIKRGASVRGGHEMCVIGYTPTGATGTISSADLLEVKNSWGTSWGTRGFCRISVATFERLLGEQGDVVVPVPLPVAPPPEPEPEPGVSDADLWEHLKDSWEYQQAWAIRQGLT